MVIQVSRERLSSKLLGLLALGEEEMIQSAKVIGIVMVNLLFSVLIWRMKDLRTIENAGFRRNVGKQSLEMGYSILSYVREFLEIIAKVTKIVPQL